MTSSNPDDVVAYHVVIDGLDPESQRIALSHFQTQHGGARPHDLSLYVSVASTVEQIEGRLSWVTENLAGRFGSTAVLASITTKLTCGEFIVPEQLLFAAARHGAKVKVLFATPARAASAFNVASV